MKTGGDKCGDEQILMNTITNMLKVLYCEHDKVEILLFKVQRMFQAQNLREAERCKGYDGHNM